MAKMSNCCRDYKLNQVFLINNESDFVDLCKLQLNKVNNDMIQFVIKIRKEDFVVSSFHLLSDNKIALLYISVEGGLLRYNDFAVKMFKDIEKMKSFLALPRLKALVLGTSQIDNLYVEKYLINYENMSYNMTIFPYPGVTGAKEFILAIEPAEAWERWIQGEQSTVAIIQSVIDAISDGIIIVDANGYVRQTNRSYNRMVNIEKDDYAGKHTHELLEAGMIHAELTPMVVEQDRAVSIVDLRNDKDILMTGTPIRNIKGKIISVVCNVRDVSELRHLKELLEASKKTERMYLQQLEQITKEQRERRFIVESPKMQQIVNLCMRVAPTDSTITITGESGTGKGALAAFIHGISNRSGKDLVHINCGAIPPALIESELFGYEAGAFTGASSKGKQGLFEMADGGTLFLDEIGELPLNMQVKVLQAIQEKAIMRIGGKKVIRLNIRIITATNRDLKKMILEKTFREDLYYRLNVISIHIPPLRERKDEIMALSSHFLEQFNRKYGFDCWFSEALIKAFLAYQWPGNIRELENAIERLVVSSISSEIAMADFIEMDGVLEHMDSVESFPLKEILEQKERSILINTYLNARNTRKAAKILGISQSSFVKKAQKYQISLNK